MVFTFFQLFQHKGNKNNTEVNPRHGIISSVNISVGISEFFFFFLPQDIATMPLPHPKNKDKRKNYCLVSITLYSNFFLHQTKIIFGSFN